MQEIADDLSRWVVLALGNVKAQSEDADWRKMEEGTIAIADTMPVVGEESGCGDLSGAWNAKNEEDNLARAGGKGR